MTTHPIEAGLIEILSRSPEVGAPASEARLICFYLLRRLLPEPFLSPSRLTDVDSLISILSADPARAALLEEFEQSAVSIAEQRADGRLLQHLLGKQFFLNHDYLVSPSVLVPRPETEILVTHAIEWARFVSSRQRKVRFAELGLGSGVISCEILAAIPEATGVASEQSPDATIIAKENLLAIAGKGFEQRLQLLLAPSPDTGFEIFLPHSPFDLIVSNPPYVSPDDEIEAQVLREEPHSALFAPSSVNAFYQNFATHGHALLCPGGRALFEIPHERCDEILSLFRTAGFQALTLPDFTGRPRVLVLE